MIFIGLITEKANVKWHSRNKNHYVEKGYLFTNFNDYFEIDVKDLIKGSRVNVDVQCDGEHCNKILKIPWDRYQRLVRSNDTYYCVNCSKRTARFKERRAGSILKNSISFKNWCITNKRDEILHRWDYELNSKTPDEVSYCTHEKFWFYCPIGKHDSELKSIKSFVLGQEGSMYCKKCFSFGQFVIDHVDVNFFNSYWDENKNEVSPWEVSYGSTSVKVWIVCQNRNYHGSYLVSCNDFTNKSSRCPFCNNHRGKVHPLDSLGQYVENNGYELLKIWSERNSKSPFSYPPFSNTNVYWKCTNLIHKDYKRKICISTTLNYRCPECSRERTESFLQEKVRTYLNELGYNVKNEYLCNIIPIHPKRKTKLPFDNEVEELKLIVEVNGKHHYEIDKFILTEAKSKNIPPEKQLQYRKLIDRYKRMYAKLQGYYYLEIPHWTEKDDHYKYLINNKINEIKLKDTSLC